MWGSKYKLNSTALSDAVPFVAPEAPDEEFEIEMWSDIEPIRSRWNAIERSGACTPFQSYGWVSALLKTAARKFGAEPHIVIVKHRASGEDLMLLPLVRRRGRVLRFLEIPDFGISDYNSPIISRSIVGDASRVAAVWNAAMKALPAGDVIRFQKIPEILSDTHNPLGNLQGLSAETYSSWQLALPENFADLEQKTLSSATRRQIRRRTRQLEASGDLHYVTPASETERKAIFDILREQRQARFIALGRRNILASPAHSGFYDLLLGADLDPDMLAVHALKVGDETIATVFGLFWQKRFYLLMSTMASGKWLELSPGIVMIWKLIAHMHAKGCRTFDFTIGDEPYKRQLGATECKLFHYYRATSLVGSPYILGLRLKPSLVAIKRKITKTAARRSSPNAPAKHVETKSET